MPITKEIIMNKIKRNNWVVGEVYKGSAYNPLDSLNIHDPNNLYEWVDEQPSWSIRAIRMAFVATKTKIAKIFK